MLQNPSRANENSKTDISIELTAFEAIETGRFLSQEDCAYRKLAFS